MPKNRTSNKSNNNESANRKTKKLKSSKDNTLKNNLDTNKTASGSVESVTDSFQNADGAAGNGEVAEVNRIINDPAENTDTNAGLTPMNEMSPEMIYAQLGHMYRKAENCRTVRRKSKAKTILDDHMAMRKSPELIAEIYRAKGFGVTAGGYIDFINNDPIWEKHPEEHKICLGVVKFYSKHPEPPVAYKNFSVVFTNYELNPNEANKALLVEVLIWICDFISMAKATTAHITAFTGIVKVRLDAICRTPSNIGYKLLWEYYPEGWAEALEVRIENYDEYKEKRDKAWMADVVPDDHMKKYLREGRVLCMKEHPTRPEALELLRKGKMLAFGSIGLDDTGNFTDFSPWTTTHYDELKALLNDIVGDFNAV